MDRKKLIIGTIFGISILSVLAAAFLLPRGGQTGGFAFGAGGDQIGVIHVEGVITGGRSGGSPFGDAVAGADTIIAQIRQARDDAAVKAVVLRINSPGGSSAASQEIGEELKKLREAGKIVVTSMGDVAASGGYWLAACTDRIVANPATTTGSIGVILSYQNMEELYRKIGIRPDPIKSAPLKDIGSPSRPMTPEERAILQGMVDDIYDQFVNIVAAGRKLPVEKVKPLADGRIFTGRQAKDLGLVDDLGNFYDAIDIAAAMAGIKGTPGIKEFGKPSPLEILLGGMQGMKQLAAELQFLHTLYGTAGELTPR